jgi:hypothetical protein
LVETWLTTGEEEMKNSEFEEYIAAKPRTKEVPGYFDDAGKFTRGPFFAAYLGKQMVGMRDMPGYIKEAGAYLWRSAALDAAKAFQAKCQEQLLKAQAEKEPD